MNAVYELDGRVWYRASALGGCPKALAALRQGYDPVESPKKIMRAYKRGEVCEKIGLNWLRKNGWDLHGFQYEVVVDVSEKLKVIGHVDALGIKDGLMSVVEVKSSKWDNDPKTWETWRLAERYSYQFSSYIVGIGKPLTLVAVDPDTGGVQVEGIYTPPRTLEDIRTRVLLVEAMARKEIDEVECEESDYPCPVYYLHKKREVKVEDDEELGELARAYSKAKRDARIAKDREERSKRVVEEYIGVPDIGGRVTRELEGVRVTLSRVAGSAARTVEIREGKPWTKLTVTLKEDVE